MDSFHIALSHQSSATQPRLSIAIRKFTMCQVRLAVTSHQSMQLLSPGKSMAIAARMAAKPVG